MEFFRPGLKITVQEDGPFILMDCFNYCYKDMRIMLSIMLLFINIILIYFIF